MRSIITIARHDLQRTLADRSATMWMFVLPLAFATFFGLVMGGGSQSPQDARAALTVVDEDGGPLAESLIADLATERLAITRIPAAAKDVTEDKVRTLIIPAGFSAQILAGEQVTIRLEKDPGTSGEAALVAEARITAAISRLIGRLIEAGDAVGDNDGLTAAAVVGRAPANDLVRVEARFAGHARIVPGGFAQSIPGNAVMFVMLVALTYGAASVTAERTGGQLRRLLTTPASRREIILGKICGRLVTAMLQVIVLVAVAAAADSLFDISIGDNVLSLLVVLLVYTIAVAPLGVLLGAWFRDPDRAANIGVLVTMVMAAFGGCWWPLEVVSKPLQTLALALPTGWAMRALHGVISFGYPLTRVAVPLLVLVGYAVAFTVLASRSLRVE